MYKPELSKEELLPMSASLFLAYNSFADKYLEETEKNLNETWYTNSQHQEDYLNHFIETLNNAVRLYLHIFNKAESNLLPSNQFPFSNTLIQHASEKLQSLIVIMSKIEKSQHYHLVERLDAGSTFFDFKNKLKNIHKLQNTESKNTLTN